MRLASCLLPAALALASASAAAQTTTARPGAVLLDTAVLKALLLDESSGVVESRRRPGIYWTLNDSGNDPLLFTTDSTGADLGHLRLLGARNIDWEDLSIGRCSRSRGTCLFVADIGDNNANRRDVTIYVVPEPEPSREAGDTVRTVSPEDTVVLRYPDHPHNAEALAVTSTSMLLVTKDLSGPAVLYRTPLRMEGARVLERVAALAIRTSALRGRIATGAAVRGDTLLVVRTYATIHLFTLKGSQPVPLTDENGIGIPVVEAQGEGVAFDAEGRLILTSERGFSGHAIISRLRLTGLGIP